MATATARIPVLMTDEEKLRISNRAKAAGLSMGEYMRRAADSFRPTEDEHVLEAMIDQMVKATERADHAIDDTLRFVAESNKRIEEMSTRNKRS